MTDTVDISAEAIERVVAPIANHVEAYQQYDPEDGFALCEITRALAARVAELEAALEEVKHAQILW